MYCTNCGCEIKEGARYCPSCGSAIETTAREVAPVANPEGDRIQSESFSGRQEGHRQAPPSKSAVERNSRGRFSGRASKKGLFLVIAGILILVALGAGGYWWMHRVPGATTSSNDIVIEKDQAGVPVEKKAEETGKQTESRAPQTPPEKPAPAPPVQEKKTVKKVPKVPAAPAPAPTPKWTYRPDPQPSRPAPAPKPQAQRNGIGAWLDKTLGPERPVTPPPSVSDARGTGQ